MAGLRPVDELGWRTLFQLPLTGTTVAEAVGAADLDEVDDEEALSAGRTNEGGGASAGMLVDAVLDAVLGDSNDDPLGLLAVLPVCVGVSPPTGVGVLETAGEMSDATNPAPPLRPDDAAPSAPKSSASPKGSSATGFSAPRAV